MAERATAEWSIFHLKAIGLPRLVADLERLERTGYPESVCSMVRDALKSISDTTDASEGTFWKPCVSSELQEFRKVYSDWNSRGEGTSAVDRIHRKQTMMALRELRKKIARNLKHGRKHRSNLLHSPGDGKLAAGAYEEFSKITAAHSKFFPGLTAAVLAFNRPEAA